MSEKIDKIVLEMPYGRVEISSKEDAICFIKNRCNNCQYSNEMWRCSGYQASLCEQKERKVIEALKGGAE